MTEQERTERRHNRIRSTTEVAQACARHADVAPFARIVGRWVWVEFPAPPSADIRDWLKAQGFHWNRDRSAWQHPCGRFTQRSPGDPRDKYITIPVESMREESIADATS